MDVSEATITLSISEPEKAPGPPVIMPPMPAPQDQDISAEADTDDSSICSDYVFREVDTMVDKAYKYPESNNSLICDILAMYLKGQKILYTEAKTHCEQRLNFLMLPAIFITALCTILSLVLKDLSYGPTIVSSLNGVNAFILALINYLKLDARAEAHRVSAYKFDKCQSYVEFNSGKILFETKASEELGEIIKKIQHDVEEIKETNQFVLPEAIRYEYPRLHNMNVFAEVKHIQNREMRATNELKDMWNDELALRRIAAERPLTAEEEARAVVLKDQIRRQTDRILRILDEYAKIDEQFETEMRAHRERAKRSVGPCNWLKM
jgi:hypothetical protein